MLDCTYGHGAKLSKTAFRALNHTLCCSNKTWEGSASDDSIVKLMRHLPAPALTLRRFRCTGWRSCSSRCWRRDAAPFCSSRARPRRRAPVPAHGRPTCVSGMYIFAATFNHMSGSGCAPRRFQSSALCSQAVRLRPSIDLVVTVSTVPNSACTSLHWVLLPYGVSVPGSRGCFLSWSHDASQSVRTSEATSCVLECRPQRQQHPLQDPTLSVSL